MGGIGPIMGGAIPNDWVGPAWAPNANTTTQGLQGLLRVHLQKLKPILSPTTRTGVRYEVITQEAGKFFDIGYYAINGTTLTLVGSTGSTASPAPGIYTTPFLVPITFLPGTEYMVGVGSDGSGTVFVTYLQRPGLLGPPVPGLATFISVGTSCPLPLSLTIGTQAPAILPVFYAV